MIDFTKNNNSIVAENKVLIGGLTYMLTDDEAIKLNDIINGMISTRNTTTSVALNTTTTKQQTTTITTTKQSKKSDKFPNLGEPTCTLTYITAYSKLVRYWEVQRFVPDKVKYALKHAIAEAGGEWNKDKCAYEFKTVKACNDFLKAQKAREEANKKK